MTALPALLLAAAAAPATPSPATEAASLGTPVADAELATMRGGFQLPNGMMLELSVDIIARLDGVTAYAARIGSDGNATLTVPTQEAAGGANVSLESHKDGVSVRLASSSLGILQTLGRVTGIEIVNTGGNRTIDVQTSINAQLSGVAAAQYAPMLSALRIAGNATPLR